MTEIRMEQVKKLLENPETGLRISALWWVMIMPGILTKVFKQYMGMTPSEYRKRY